VVSEAPIPFEVVWEMVRRGEPAPPPALEEDQLARIRAGVRAALGAGPVGVRRWPALTAGRLADVSALARLFEEAPSVRSTLAGLSPGLAALADPSEETRKAARALLAPVLEDPEADAEARLLAILAAGMTGPNAAAPLFGLRDGPAADAALFALGLTGHPGAREILVSAVLPPPEKERDREDAIRRAVLVFALSRIPGPEVQADLVRRTGDPAPEVRAAAALSLALRADGGAGARLALRDHARRGSLYPRSAALLALALVGDAHAVPAARTALRDPVLQGTGLPALAALCLGLMRSAPDGPGLVTVFADRDREPGLRAAAILAAGLCRARDSAERVVKILAHEKDERVYGYGLVGLSLLDGDAAVDLIADRLDREKRKGVRVKMMTALGYAGGERAASLLAKHLGADDLYFVNLEAARALFRADPERAVAASLAGLADEKEAGSVRFASLVLAGAVERRAPSFFAEVVLGTGIRLESPIARLCLYLEDEAAFDRILGGK
jgi:hypothetical protein